MTVQPGELIQASDFVEISGEYNLTQAYPDALSCANRVTAMYGMGYGDYGYGQQVPQIDPPISETVIKSLQQQWTSLGQAMQFIATHTQTVIAPIPDLSELQPSAPIQATGYDWATAAQQLDANRMQWHPDNMTLHLMLSSLRSSSWVGSVSHEFSADFGSEQAARFFFNAGGHMIVKPRLSDPTDALSTDWQDLLLLVDEIWVGLDSTTQTGSGGVPSSLGYYDLTDVYQVLFTQSSTGMYTSNSVTLWARRSAYEGVAGANGSVIEFRLQFINGVGGSVSGTCSNEVYVLRASTEEVEVAAPHVRAVQNLDGAPVLTYYEFTLEIADTEQDLNVLEAAQTVGYDLVDPLYARIIFKPTGVLRSSLTEYPALLVPDLPAQSVVMLVLEPGAVIAGAGGAGGTGAPSGSCGCEPGQPGLPGGPALELHYPVHVLNYGVIGGGGGGGGGGGAECVDLIPANAGGGGGGASFGTGGTTNVCGVSEGNFASPGESGTLLQGGSGGSSGNVLTAQGGAGGALGQAGESGQSIHSLGGTGGANGLAIQNVSWVTSYSSLGDIRGGTN